MGNLVLGRQLHTMSVCGHNKTEAFCSYGGNPGGHSHAEALEPLCSKLLCGKCSAAHRHLSHLPSDMSDSSFRNPHTWWQSAEGVVTEAIQLDLETEFYFTHLILVFRSPRPAALALDRSQDFGHTWTTLQRYASNCSQAFGLSEGNACTQKYSGAYPCTRGEVIYRVLSPWNRVDPYNASTRTQLAITNLRVRLLRRQPCPCQLKEIGAKLSTMPTEHYAVYDFIAKGSCLCNGHAEQCVPTHGYKPGRDGTNHVVHGRCVCRHHTAGPHCERCSPLYNDQPWQPANGITGASNECKKCTCNGHAESCRFDVDAWLRSGQQSGGVCDCLHNTEGQNCHRCKSGFYRDPHRPHVAPDSCKQCVCDTQGSVPEPSGVFLCNRQTGDCLCRPGVGGAHCDTCMVGFWGFHDYGCKPCHCAGDCDPFTGDCIFVSSDQDFPFVGNATQSQLFHVEELFSALRYSEKCVCKEANLRKGKEFCAMKYDYVLKVKVLSAHDKGSHAEVQVKVKKVLWHRFELQLSWGPLTLYPVSWTARGCTCPVLYPGMEYLVAGHANQRKGHLLVNMKSFVKPWRASLGYKVLHLLKNICM
uniref:Netrin 4 n=1 Tax=Denticeps clupeoides TaxID=299321 RepID=A0AAY4DSE8_9TELE